MNRAIIFMFNSEQPLSISAIAACAKAISLNSGTSIEDMIAKQLDEDDIAAAIASGIRIGAPEIVVEHESKATDDAVKVILNKFNDYMVGPNRDIAGFAAALSSYVAAAKFTGCDPAMLKSLKILKDVEHNKHLNNLGITKSICDVIHKVANYV